MLKVGDYVRFTCRCGTDCRRYADKNTILIVATDGYGYTFKFLNGKPFQGAMKFSEDNVTPEPFLGAVAKALRRKTRVIG